MTPRSAGGQEASIASAAGRASARGGGRGGGTAPAAVEVADAGPAAVAKAKQDLPTGPTYASAAPAAPEPAAKPQVVAALEEPVASDASAESPVKLTGPIAALYLAPLPPRRPANLEQQLALLANIPFPRSDLPTWPRRPPRRLLCRLSVPLTWRSSRRSRSVRRRDGVAFDRPGPCPAAGDRGRGRASVRSRGVGRGTGSVAERHHRGRRRSPPTSALALVEPPRSAVAADERAARARGRADRAVAADADSRPRADRRSGADSKAAHAETGFVAVVHAVSVFSSARRTSRRQQ